MPRIGVLLGFFVLTIAPNLQALNSSRHVSVVHPSIAGEDGLPPDAVIVDPGYHLPTAPEPASDQSANAASSATEEQLKFGDVVSPGSALTVSYHFVDPVSPAWSYRETHLPGNRVEFQLEMQRLRSSGRGEARQVVDRRARALARASGFRAYQLQRYEESIASAAFFPQRRAEATIVFFGPANKSEQ